MQFCFIVDTGYSQTAKDYYIKGCDKIDLKDYIGAIADFNKAIELNHEYINAYYNRGSAKGNLQDFRGAIADFNIAIKLNAKLAVAYYS